MAEKKTTEETGMDSIEARVEAILAKAQAKADEIIANAEKSAGSIGSTSYNPDDYANLEDYVTVRLFKDKTKYKEDVLLSVNGENCLVQRGKDVRIKRKFALVLEQSLAQDEFAASFSEALQSEYADKEASGKL